MKKLAAALLTTLTLPVYAQGILGSLTQYQNSLEPKPSRSDVRPSGTPSTDPTPEVRPGGQSSSSTAKCEENDQKSLPLNYLTSLILEKDANLDIKYDPRAGSLAVTSADMIGNCSNMLEWKLKQPTIQGSKAYAIEVRFKDGDPCTEEGCVYRVTKVENGTPKMTEVVLKPSLEGFESCLQKTGVVVGGKVVPSAIYNSPVNEKFSNITESGKLLFVSHGLSSPLIKPKYGKFDPIDRCDYYEAAHPTVSSILTFADAEKQRLDEEANKLRDCPINEYHKVADFLDKYESYSTQLGDVRDRLILEAAKKSAEAIASGKYTEDDLKVLGDFDKYIVQPKIEQAIALYNEMIELEGDAKKAKQDELKAVLSQIAALNQKPYFIAAHTEKLLKDGRFEEAEKLNTMKLMLQAHQRLGAKENNVVITPPYARTQVQNNIQAFSEYLVQERERYEIRTGQSSGKSQYYTQLAARMRQNIQVRNQNFTQEIQSEYARLQAPNGYCYKYWRNAQKCQQDTIERIQELQTLLQHYNKVDTERAAEYDQKAKEYGDLEAEGRRYIAAQNGEAVPQEQPQQPQAADTTAAPTRPAETNQPQQGVYSFQFNGAQGQQQMTQQQQLQLQQQQQLMAQQQAQVTPQMYQYPTNPYVQQNMYQQQYNPYMQQQQYQTPYLGQQAYGQYGMQGYMGAQTGYMMPSYGQNSYSFNFNGGATTGQMYPTSQYGYQQNMMYGGYSPYMQQPTQYNMYGGLRLF